MNQVVEAHMLDAIGTILATTAIAVVLTSVVTTMPVQLQGRLALAGGVGAWVGLAASIAAAGYLAGNPLTVLAFFTFPLVLTGILGLRYLPARTALRAIPMPLLIGLNLIRVGGLLFVALALAGRLAGPFPYTAGLGDFLTGALAIPVALLAAKVSPSHNRLIAAWNAFGAFDLIVAVALGITSRNGSPIQLIHAGVGTAAMTELPWALVPTVLVPFFLIAHSIVFAQLRARVPRETAATSISAGRLEPRVLGG
jgi:hypothetical protein